jgi:hypothetical protein
MESKLVIFICVLVFSLLSCNPDKKGKINPCNTNIKNVRVLYYNGLKTTDTAIRSIDIINQSKRNTTNYGNLILPSVVDTLITQCSVLEEIDTELTNFKESENQSIDARMLVFINYKNGTSDKMCISGYFVDNIIYKEVFQSNNRFLYLIKYYSGFYSFVSDSELSYMKEIQDTSFHKKLIKAINYK